MRNAPVVQAVRRAAVARSEAAGADGLAHGAVIARGEVVGGVGLALGSPVRALKEGTSRKAVLELEAGKEE